jgi:hypothetical protein
METYNSEKPSIALVPTKSPGDFVENYSGFLDAANASSIAGWCWDRSRPNIPLGVEIYADAHLIAQVRADGYRSDLKAAGKGNGCHGFTVAMPAALRDGHSHAIAVNIVDTQSPLTSSPMSYTGN